MITVARVEPSKRPFDFLQIAKRVFESVADVEFVWIGDGTLRKQMEEQIRTSRLSKTAFPGSLSNESTRALMRGSSVYISTSESEGFALTPGEALLSHLPVVVYDLPVYTEVYDDYLLKVKMFELDEFAEKVKLALTRPPWLTEKVDEGASFVESTYSPHSVGQKATRALLEILRG